MGALEMVQEQYPHLAWLLGDPEIGPLLTQAVDPNAGFDANTFQAKIQQTNWFRSRTEEERKNEIQQHTDPATFWRSEAGPYADSLRELSAHLGRPLNDAETQWLTAAGMNAGVSPDSATMRAWLRPLIRGEDVIAGQGAAGVASSQIAGIIRGNWFHFSDTLQDLGHNIALAGNVAQGVDSLESINARYATWAQAAYPHLKEQIAAGMTMADIFNPYRSIIADELEMGSAEDVDMNNPEWRQIIQWRDPKTNEVRLPTASEVQVLARSRPQWWQTSKGRQADAGATRSMLQIFGQVR